MSYKDLWSNTSPVLKQSEQHLVYFENFVSAVEKRIEVEQSYAMNLREITQTIEKQMGNKQDGSMIFLLSAFKSNLTRRLNQTMIFANSLRSDVLNFVKHPLQKQIADSNQVRKQILDLHAEHFNRWNKLGESRRQLKVFNKLREQQFIALQINKSKFIINKSQEEKILQGVRKAEKDYQDAENRTKQTIKGYNSFIGQFQKGMDINLSILEEQERERVTVVLDNMKKILVFEVSMMRNFEYDVAGVSSHLETIDVEKDIVELIKRNNNYVPKYSNEGLKKATYMDTSLLGMIKKSFDEKIKLNNDESVQVFIVNLQKGQNKKELIEKKNFNIEEFTRIFKLILFSQVNQLNNADISELNEFFEKEINRNYAQLCIKQIVKSKSYNNSRIVALIQLFIDICISKRDVFCIRSIAKLILFQLTPSNLKLKEKQLYDRLLNLQVWKSHGFWNAALFEGIQEQLKITHLKKGQDKRDARERERNIVVAQIEYWCVLMVMMGYELIRVEELAAKYSKFYNLNQKEYEYISKKILEGDKLYIKLSGENKTKNEEKPKPTQK